MRFLPSDHTGWWVAFWLARNVVFSVISLVLVLSLGWGLMRSGITLPDMVLNVLWVTAWVALEWQIGDRLAARERARFGR